jgi:peptidoglycan/xylan/chitin deacetylase (PgdA/CDA1 family)
MRIAETVRLMPAVRRVFADRCIILSFHEIHENPARELMAGTAAAFLDDTLGWLRRNGWDIVSLDEMLRRLSEERPAPRSVVLTFDDGYRDNATIALPILEKHHAPFTLFVPTASLDRTLYSWWLALRTLFLDRDAVDIEAMGQRFSCADLDAKLEGFRLTRDWVHQDLRRSSLLAPTFLAAGISLPALNDRFFLDEGELKDLARHPLATIGAHTSSHLPLATLDAALARREMAENRIYLEGLIEHPVSHIAYPYGNDQACGIREARLAADLGFASAVTTIFHRLGADFHRHLLPRLGVTAQTPTRFDAQMSGLRYSPAPLDPPSPER